VVDLCRRRATGPLRLNLGDTYAGKHALVSTRLPEALTALLLEDPHFLASGLAVHDSDDSGIGDERSAGDDVAGIFFDDEYLIERELGARFSGATIDLHDLARRDLELVTATLNDGVHVLNPLSG